MSVLTEVRVERARQVQQWGGKAHDDEHPMTLWDGLLWKHLRKFSACMVRGDSAGMRHRLIVVAALAVALVESLDRRRQVNESVQGTLPAHEATVPETAQPEVERLISAVEAIDFSDKQTLDAPDDEVVTVRRPNRIWKAVARALLDAQRKP